VSTGSTNAGAALSRLQIEADGGSRGNPGPAAYGSVVRNPQTHEVLAAEGTTIGEDTNNVAEYRGLIAALTLAREINPDAILEARLDSKLIVEQMSGRWQVKHERMRQLVKEAHKAFDPNRVSYKWVPREQNKTADALVNAALDGSPSRVIYWDRIGREAPAPSADDASVDMSSIGEAPERVIAKVSLPGFAPDLGAPTTVLLARHGVTAHTLDKRFSGSSTDLPLAPQGVSQAEALAAEVMARGGADVLVTSPVRRARETAQIVGAVLGLEPELDAGFVEAEFGEWDGYTFAEVRSRWPKELDAWLASTDVAPPGGESFSEVRDRVDIARRELLERHAGKRILVVSHVTPIKTMVGLAIDAPLASLFRMHMAPCSLTTVQWWADGNASMSGFGESAHLRHIKIPDGA
jgi:broad specificity phosphatase PhoE/ribonuclease HI